MWRQVIKVRVTSVRHTALGLLHFSSETKRLPNISCGRHRHFLEVDACKIASQPGNSVSKNIGFV